MIAKRARATTRSGRRPALTPTVIFLLRLALVWLGAIAVFTLVPEVERWVVRATIASVQWSAPLVGIAFTMQGDLFRLAAGPPARVGSDCTTLIPTTLLWSGILAYPASARWKLVGLALGALILWAYNLVRILVMFAINGWDPGFVTFVHVYLWQTVTIGFACALFLLWTRKAPLVASRT